MRVILLMMLSSIIVSAAGVGKAPTSETQGSATTQPASAPATTQATQPAISKELETILDELEKKREQIKTLEATLKYQTHELIPDVTKTQTGVLKYQAREKDSPVRFMIRFDELIQEDLRITHKEWFCFNGKVFREVREHTKTVRDYKVDRDEKEVDPFALGEGPFPLPYGQKKSDMLKNFQITLVPPKEDEVGTVHLALVPREGTPLAREYKQLDFWLDRKDYLPQRIVTENRYDTVITVWFSDVKVNVKLSEKDLWKDQPGNYSYEESNVQH